jgi:hypothetical protein
MKRGRNMVKALFLITLVGLASASHVASAADAAWVAVSTLERGTSQNCGGGQGDWKMEIRGQALTYVSPTNVTRTIDLKALQADGSGKVTAKDDKNREFYLTFEPGSGPRIIHFTNSLNACGWLFTLKK